MAKNLECKNKYIKAAVVLFRFFWMTRGRLHVHSWREAYAILYEIFIKKNYEIELPDKAYIVDGGANIGLVSLYYRKLYPESEIVSYEPTPSTFEVLRKNVHGKNIKAINEALSSEDGTAEFYVHKGSTGNTMYGSKNSKNITVRTRKLDNRRAIDLLKLDVEFSEWDVLRTTDLSKVKNIILEIHDNRTKNIKNFVKIIQLFEENGFWYKIMDWRSNQNALICMVHAKKIS